MWPTSFDVGFLFYGTKLVYTTVIVIAHAELLEEKRQVVFKMIKMDLLIRMDFLVLNLGKLFSS